jgi:hypothetical protein
MLVFRKTDRLLLDHMRSVLETEGSLEAKAQRISQMIRAAGAYDDRAFLVECASVLASLYG